MFVQATSKSPPPGANGAVLAEDMSQPGFFLLSELGPLVVVTLVNVKLVLIAEEFFQVQTSRFHLRVLALRRLPKGYPIPFRFCLSGCLSALLFTLLVVVATTVILLSICRRCLAVRFAARTSVPVTQSALLV